MVGNQEGEFRPLRSPAVSRGRAGAVCLKDIRVFLGSHHDPDQTMLIRPEHLPVTIPSSGASAKMVLASIFRAIELRRMAAE